jgi:hypothetical protein
MPDSPAIFCLEAIKAPWGDYGRILAHGMSRHLGRQNEIIQLERTGPHIAPITFPGSGDIVVTSAFRSALEKSGLERFAFRPVIKSHIVELDWESWDPTTKNPFKYPEGGEPESYLLGQPHSPAASEALGDLWELCLEGGMDVARDGWKFVGFLPETWNGLDLFNVRTTGYSFVSQKARNWLELSFGDYVEFESVPSPA